MWLIFPAVHFGFGFRPGGSTSVAADRISATLMPLTDHDSSRLYRRRMQRNNSPWIGFMLGQAGFYSGKHVMFRFDYCPPAATLYLTELILIRREIGNKAIVAIRETAHYADNFLSYTSVQCLQAEWRPSEAVCHI
jgi:hypothetical protein